MTKKEKKLLKKKAELFLKKNFELSKKGLPELPLAVFASLTDEQKLFIAGELAEAYTKAMHEQEVFLAEQADAIVSHPR